MNKTYKPMYLEAEIICPQCGKKIVDLSPDKENAIDAGCEFLCVACKVVVTVYLIAPNRDAQLRIGADRAGADYGWAKDVCSSCGHVHRMRGQIILPCPICKDACKEYMEWR